MNEGESKRKRTCACMCVYVCVCLYAYVCICARMCICVKGDGRIRRESALEGAERMRRRENREDRV